MLEIVPFTRDLVLVGGGHAHALVLKAWGMNPLPGARLTVINPGPTAPYTGMLPGYVAGHYASSDLEIDLVKLCRHAGARLILDKVINIDQLQNKVMLAERNPVAYDIASFDIGITAKIDLPGFNEYGIGAKPLGVYARQWNNFFENVKQGKLSPNVAVIGGGIAGCELAMAMAYALHAIGVTPKVTVIEVGMQISGVGGKVRQKMLTAMNALGVVVKTNTRVLKVCIDQVLLDGQDPIAASFCIGAAGGKAHKWISQTNLPQKNGFIKINADLGVVGDNALFAVGDCAIMVNEVRPKAGVFAVRAAPILHQNIRAALNGGIRKNGAHKRIFLNLFH